MNAYVDASVLLRVVLAQPDPLSSWASIERGVSSELILVESLRTLDRARIQQGLDDRLVAERRAAILATIAALELVPLDSAILARAAEPFPTGLGTLDALHLATALAVQDQFDDLVIATHDKRLALAASSMGMRVEGVTLST